ncbi:MAG: hypothetical protein E7606_04290 [Ruminococcaceae bacterium]|nr:hypothetical protein [Oscillospiraceae bacterium]
MKKRKWKEASVSYGSLRLLHICFAMILGELFLITFQLFHGDYPTHLYAVRLYRHMLEYILLDITIAVIGAFLFDLAQKDIERK